jgi:predicted aldo/keto reductase-like oxidoreductase
MIHSDVRLLRLDHALRWLQGEIRGRHYATGIPPTCFHCRYPWPCPTQVAWEEILRLLDCAAEAPPKE